MSRTKSAWLPVLLLAALVAALSRAVNPSLSYDPPWLVLIGNTLFITVALLVVSFIALRLYLATARIEAMLLGCGVLTFALGAVVAAAVRGLPDGANLNVTVYNLAAVLSGLFHALAAFLLVAGAPFEPGARHRRLWLALGYGGSALLVSLLSVAALAHWLPSFQVPGISGFSAIRQAVLGSAVALFGFSFLVFLGTYLQGRESFLLWYSCALGLTAVSLTAFLVQSTVGGLVGWTGRLAQYLGGVYFLTSLVTAGNERSRRLSLNGLEESLLVRQAEERMRDLSRQLQAVQDAAPAIIWITRDRESRSISGNRAAHLFSQVSASTDMSKSGPHADRLAHYRIYQDGRELAPEEMPIQRVAATGQPLHECEVEFRFADGEVRFLLGNVEPLLDAERQPAGAIAAFVDVTSYKRLERRLKDQYERQEALSQIVAALLPGRDPQGAVESLAHRVMDVLDCQAFFNFLIDPECNRLRLNAYAGIPPEEAVRILWLELGGSVCGCVARDGRRIIAEDIQHTPDPRTELVRSFGIRAYACHPLTAAGGRTIGTLSFGTRTRDHFSDEDLAFMKTVTDHIAIAMERKRSAEELVQLNEALEQRVAERTAEAVRLSDQLRALASELAQAEQRERKRLATILHDHIQQLLVGARLRLGRIDFAAAPPPMRSAIDSLDAIIDEALVASRNLTLEISPPVLKQAGLIPALRWLVNQMSEKNQFAVELEADAEAEPDREEVRFLLFECIRELLFNSLKHSGVRRARLAVHRTEDSRIEIVVQDQGAGFDPGQSPNQDGNVTAFGLFSIEQRLAYIGGTLLINSAPGRGARLSILAPIGAPAPRASEARESVSPSGREPEHAAGAPAEGGKIRVLIVDDHKIMREGLSELLGLEKDIEIVGGAADGPQAIEMAEKLQPEVIIMDINLGSMDGIEATRIILGRNPSIKVIGLSMHQKGDVAQPMRDAGAVAYLSKGGPAKDLAEAIRACRQRA